MGLYGVKPRRVGYRNRQRSPRPFQRDELSVPDVMQRVHWGPSFARRSGNPATFDHGRKSETWLIHLCTDWMGDDAWLWTLDCELRRFNDVGDTRWLNRTGAIQRRLPAHVHRLLPPVASVQVQVACAMHGWAGGGSAHFATSPGRWASTRCSSTASGSPTASGWVRSEPTGRWPVRRCPGNARWCRDREGWTASVGAGWTVWWVWHASAAQQASRGGGVIPRCATRSWWCAPRSGYGTGPTSASVPICVPGGAQDPRARRRQ